MKCIFVYAMVLCSCNNGKNQNLTIRQFKNYSVLANFENDSIIEGVAKFYTMDKVLFKIENYKNGIKNSVSIDF